MCQPGDVPVIWDLMGLGPLETGRHREHKSCLWRSLESCGGYSSLGEQHPIQVKAGARLLAAALPHIAHGCEQLGACGFVRAFLCHSFLCGCEASQLERAFFQGNHNCADLSGTATAIVSLEES